MNIRILSLSMFLSASTCLSAAQAQACTTITQLPVKITVAGDYCLANSFEKNFVAADVAAIRIDAHEVTIDLRGHAIIDSSPGGAAGIQSNGKSHIVIRNGTLTGFDTGVVALSPAGGEQFHKVENMTIRNSQIAGIRAQVSVVEILRNHILGGRADSAHRLQYGISVGKPTDGSHSARIVENVIDQPSVNAISVINASNVMTVGNRILNAQAALAYSGPVIPFGKVHQNMSDSHVYGYPAPESKWLVEPNF